MTDHVLTTRSTAAAATIQHLHAVTAPDESTYTDLVLHGTITITRRRGVSGFLGLWRCDDKFHW